MKAISSSPFHIKHTSLILIAVFILFACQKNTEVIPDKKYNLSRMIRHHFSGDSSTYYDVSYTNGLISQMIGDWNDYYEISYDNSTGNPSQLNRTHYHEYGGFTFDSCTYDNSHTNLLWTQTQQDSYSPYYLTSTTYSGNSKSVQYYEQQYISNNNYQLKVVNNAKVSFDVDGDATSIKFYEAASDTLLYTMNISYINKQNKFNEFYKDFELIDPFCRAQYGSGFNEETGYSYPVNIHYGKKCLSSFEVIYQNGTKKTHPVSYTFNDGEYIKEIKIDGNKFMEYEFEEK